MKVEIIDDSVYFDGIELYYLPYCDEELQNALKGLDEACKKSIDNPTE